MNILAWAAIFAFLFTPLASAEVIISEVMNNPIGDEERNEWIELYNDGNDPVNISDALLCGKKLGAGYIDNENTPKRTNDMSLGAGQYALITNGYSSSNPGTEVYSEFEVPTTALSLHLSNSVTICSGLSNDKGKHINFTYRNTTISFIYTNDNANNLPTGQTMQFDDQELEYCDPTPGKENCPSTNSNQNNNSSSPVQTSGSSTCSLSIETAGELFKAEEDVDFSL